MLVPLTTTEVSLYLVDTAGTFYEPTIDVVPGCASYRADGFSFQSLGDAVTECAVWQVPDSVVIDKVQFGETLDSSGEVHTLGEWSVS